jgi:amino acid transporter
VAGHDEPLLSTGPTWHPTKGIRLMDLSSVAKLVVFLLILAGGILVRIVVDKWIRIEPEEARFIDTHVRRWATGIMVAIVFVDCVITFPKWPRRLWIMVGIFTAYGIYSLVYRIARRTRTTPPGQ